MVRLPSALIAAAVLPLALASPAAAQDSAGDRVNQLIVYGDDPCPVSSGDEITVCARKDEGERFRIPEILRAPGSSPANVAWTERVEAYETVGAQGVQSCSPVGPGGATGCLTRLIDAAYEERAAGGDVRFARLIEEERAKRLATIDDEAAETQARVEVLEREYQRKLDAERAADTPDEAGARGATAGGGLATPPQR